MGQAKNRGIKEERVKQAVEVVQAGASQDVPVASYTITYLKSGQVRVDGSLNMPFPFIVKTFAAGLIAVSNHKEQEAKSRIVVPQMGIAGGK